MRLFNGSHGSQTPPPAIPAPAQLPLYWLAEPAAPIDDPHGGSSADVFVTIGDTVALVGGPDRQGLIVGEQQNLPIVQITQGADRGRIKTIDPDDIVAAIILRRILG